MAQTLLTQRTIENQLDDSLMIWVEAFLIDRKAQNLSPGTLRFYQQKIKLFTDYCEGQAIGKVGQITPDVIRRYLLYLGDTHHNAGGIHGAYRALHAFLTWWESEVEPEGWKNPISKVKAPKVPDEPIEPVELSTVKAMIEACTTNAFTDARDKALMLFLLDTGVRAAELCALDLADVDQFTGAVLVRQGKGRKPRTVYLEKKARRAYRVYVKMRSDREPAAWVSDEFDRMPYDTLRWILERRAKRAGAPIPTPHDFRRAFAINMLRQGVDLVTLSRLMGHASLAVLKRYLTQANIDLKEAHVKGSPVEHGGF